MAATGYRRLTRKGDPRTGFVVPKEIFRDLEQSARENCRKLNEEIIARLARTLEEPELMSHDRLMRLIFCKKLAWKGKD